MNQAEFDLLRSRICEEIRTNLGVQAAIPASLAPFQPPAGDPASFIDHTLLKADATHQDIVKLCREAAQYRFASVCVNASWVPLAVSELSTSKVKVCTVIGFPLGATLPEVKAYEAEAALRLGANELDMVLNIGALRDADYNAVLNEIRAIVEIGHRDEAIVKVILETALLDDVQKGVACVLASMAHADFVKTSTGFGPSGATVHDVALMRAVVGPKMGVKASGGIRTAADFRAMIDAGANRIGASAGVQIVAASSVGSLVSGY